jgi:hypothetical protein
VVVIYFKVPSQHILDYNEENHEKHIKTIWDLQNTDTNTYSVTIKVMKNAYIHNTGKCTGGSLKW